MSRNPKTARLSTAGYRAMFTPRAPQAEKEIVIISDDEVEPLIEDDEEWMATPTPTPTPTPAVAPVYAAVATQRSHQLLHLRLCHPQLYLGWMRR